MLQKLAHPVLSYSLVLIQFASLFVLLVLEPWFHPGASMVTQILAILLGLWAVTTMHLGHFNIVPDPLPDIQLVSTGPYRWIRHPMYASLVLFFLPIAIQSTQFETWLVYLILVVNLIVKLHYEEKLLQTKLTDYRIYQEHTKKLIPYLF